MRPRLSHSSPHDELARLLAAGCPPDYAAALLSRCADWVEVGRVLHERKAGHRGNSRLLIEWPMAAGRPLIPEEVPARCPLLTDEAS